MTPDPKYFAVSNTPLGMRERRNLVRLERTGNNAPSDDPARMTKTAAIRIWRSVEEVPSPQDAACSSDVTSRANIGAREVRDRVREGSEEKSEVHKGNSCMTVQVLSSLQPIRSVRNGALDAHKQNSTRRRREHQCTYEPVFMKCR